MKSLTFDPVFAKKKKKKVVQLVYFSLSSQVKTPFLFIIVDFQNELRVKMTFTHRNIIKTLTIKKFLCIKIQQRNSLQPLGDSVLINA